jgi:hypothetical protein
VVTLEISSEGNDGARPSLPKLVNFFLLLCMFNVLIVIYVPFSVLCVLFVCKCVLYCCHRVSTRLRLNKYIISRHLLQVWTMPILNAVFVVFFQSFQPYARRLPDTGQARILLYL